MAVSDRTLRLSAWASWWFLVVVMGVALLLSRLDEGVTELPPESWRLFNDGWIAFPVASV